MPDDVPKLPQASQSLEPPYEHIRDSLREGKIIPFIGAGASLVEGSGPWSQASSFLPRASELADYLGRRAEYPRDETAELTRVAQYFDGVIGRAALDGVLHSIFAKPYQPSRLHRFLAGFDNLLIVTTNYDQLLEQAFRNYGKAFHVVIYKIGAPTFLFWKHGASQPEHPGVDDVIYPIDAVPIIYKMHGAVDPKDPERDSYLITEDDYVEFLARMTLGTAIPGTFAKPFRTRHFLFLGYGLRDWNLRVVLHKIWADFPRRYNSWSIQDRAGVLERNFWISKRGLTIYEMTIEEFLGKLDQRKTIQEFPGPEKRRTSRA